MKEHYCDVGVTPENETITHSELQQSVTAERP